MADTKVSELTSATSVGGSDVLYLVQSGTSKKVAVSTLFENASNVILRGNVAFDPVVQSLTTPGIIDINRTVTHLSSDASGGIITIPSGKTNQVKILTMIASSGGTMTISSNIANNANVTFSQAGDTAVLVYTNNKWHVIGTSAGGSSPVTSVNGEVGAVVLNTANVAESGNLYFSNARAVSAIESTSTLTTGNIIPAGNSIYNLGSPTNQWKSLYVSNNTIFIGGVPLSIQNNELIIGEGGASANLATVAFVNSALANISQNPANPFNQDLNTTDNPQFNRVGLTLGEINATQGNDFAVFVSPDGNASYELNFSNANGDLTVPNYINFAGNTFIGDEPSAGTPYFRIDTPLGYAAKITTDSDISGNNWSWTFGEDGNLTIPGDIHGAPVISGGAFPSQVGRTVNITPADDASDKKFKFRIDQYGETFTRAYLEFPTAEVDKQVAAVFPHTNGKAGYIFTQGANTNDDGMNDAFNIFYNNGDIKITSMGSLGGLHTWKFGTNGALTYPDSTTQTTAFTGNANGTTVDITNTNGLTTTYYPTFVEDRSTSQTVRADVNLTYRTDTNTLNAGGLALTGNNITFSNGASITGNPNNSNSLELGTPDYPVTITGPAFFSSDVLFTEGIYEKFTNLANANAIVTHNCDDGHIFYHTTPTSNWTVNLTNLGLYGSDVTTVTLVINQGVTPYHANVLQIGGSPQTIKWQGNITPTGNANSIDVETFSIMRVGASYVVLGQLTSFG